MFKKFTGLLLALVMAIPFTGTFAIAAGSSGQEGLPSLGDKNAIIEILQYIEPDKASFGLDSVEFGDLEVGNKICAYEYTEDGLVDLYFTFPLLYNDNIVALATEVENGNFQISTALASNLNDSGKTDVSLIYDSEGVYLFDGSEFTLLGKSMIEVSSRQSVSAVEPTIGNIVKLSSLEVTEPLGYYPVAENRADTSWSCPVGYVRQGSGSNICWAATIACISNYVNGTLLRAVDVAKRFYGEDDYDQSASHRTCEILMQNVYDLDYTYKNQIPSDNVILENLKDDFPLYGSFLWAKGSHAVTIYGINIQSGYISVMDPEFGAATAYYSYDNGYSYISDYSGVSLSLDCAICHSW